MKQMNRFSVMAALVGTLAIAGCADDVYDPERGIQTEPKDNPLGEDFAAPDGFNWSMINSVNLDVEVKDELNGSYDYLIEVFTHHPLSTSGAAPIAAGVANKNKHFTAEINISKGVKTLFIRQTDPRKRKEVYEYPVPENGGALHCKLFYEGTATRTMTRAAANDSHVAFNAAQAAGIHEIEDKNYAAATVIPALPAQSDDFVQYNPGLLADGAKYIIGKEYTDKNPFTTLIRTNGSKKATVFVQGVWKLDGWADLSSALDIYIMEGGKIIGENLTIGTGNALTIAQGGNLACTQLNLGCPTKVFGSINGGNIKVNAGNSPELFNAGTITATQEMMINGSNVINHHTLKAPSYTFVDAKILNKATIEAENSILLNSAKLFNYGTLKLDAKKGILQTNNTTGTVLINHNEATVSGYHLKCGMSLYNDGFIEVSKCTNESVDVIYNSCTLIVKETFTFRNLTQNKGSITGGRKNSADTEWVPVAEVKTLNDANLTLIDGSMIKASRFTVASGTVTFKAQNSANNPDKSMIKVADYIHFNEPAQVSLLSRNLVIEGKITGTGEWKQFKNNESVNTGFNESKYTIETCGGIFDEGNPGETPSNPQFPTEVTDSDIYTFAFEDNWPVYGDFDMNDLVLTMTDKKLKINKEGYVTSLKMFIELRAVGATKTLGAGIRFVKLPGNIQLTEFAVNSKKDAFESGQNAPTCILFTNAHTQLWGSEYTDTEKRLNTIVGGPTQKNPHKFNINMEIPASARVKPEDFNINNIDLFIITAPASKKGMRTEIHVAGFAPTELGGRHYFQSGNDNTSASEGRYYLSKENLAWAVVIPQEFAWPLETTKITKAYTKFQSWITSGGQNDPEWYKAYSEADVYPIGNLTPVN